MSDTPVDSRVTASERLTSLDALRGFDMFWIVGAGGIVHGLRKFDDSPVVTTIADQLEHVEWQGLRFYDLIFPLFVFLTGVSLVYSLSKSLERFGLGRTVLKLSTRTLLLLAVGIFFYGGFSNSWPDIRLVGVLQRIALCYFFAGLTFCFFGLRGRIAVFAGLLIGYWILLTFAPIPGVEGDQIDPQSGLRARFSEGTNLANYVDHYFLPGKRWDGESDPAQANFATHHHDPEGLLSTLPAIGTCLLGVFAGMLLKAPTVTPKKKVLYLLAAGVICIALGYLWGLQFPIIKKIWTSSYVLAAGGWSLILLGVFYCVIDVWKQQWWAMPFVWIGANALAIYLAGQLVKINDIASRLVGGDIGSSLGNADVLVHQCVAMLLVFGLANYLYRKKIFIRL